MFCSYEEPRFEVHSLGGARYATTLMGRLPIEWAANLCASLAQRRVDIRRGHAVRNAEGTWMVRFEVEAQPPITPAELDWVHLCERRSHYKNASVRLDGYQFTEAVKHGGSIRLELVETPDSVGLLAVVFAGLYSLGLVPVEFRLDTHGDRVFDEFWLKALQETRPRDEVCLALGRRLSEFVAA